MAIIYGAAAPLTVNQLIAAVRNMVGDTETVASNQRWSDAQVVEAINWELKKMGGQLGINDAGPALADASLNYPADTTSVALPDGPRSQPIYMVEDVTAANRPILLHRLSPLEANRFMDPIVGDVVAEPGYAIIGDTLHMRPIPGAAKTLRLRYVRAPYVVSTTGTPSTDQHPVAVQSEETIVLGACIRLQEVDDEVPPGRRERYEDAWMRFLAGAARYRGPRYVRRNRRWY